MAALILAVLFINKKAVSLRNFCASVNFQYQYLFIQADTSQRTTPLPRINHIFQRQTCIIATQKVQPQS